MSWIGKALGRAVYRSAGWTLGPPPEEWYRRQVVIGYPHTSSFDTVLAFAGFQMMEKPVQVLVKREAFVWPFAGLMRRLGALPVERGAARGSVESLSEELRERSELALCIMPEGTRGGVKRVKTGFWHIARAAGVPIQICYYDLDARVIRWLGPVEPTDDLDADLKRIASIYEAAGGRFPV